MKSGISIAIPTWEMYGKGVQFLNHSFNQLKIQTFQNFEVIITDDSKDDRIQELCYNNEEHFDIHYYRNPHPPGIPVNSNINTAPKGSVNTNFAVTKCNRKIIKFLYQDDFLYSEDSLEITYNTFIKNNSKWLVTDCMHTEDGINLTRRLTPQYHDEIHLGVNTISSPSVLSVINDNVLRFDERLIVLMDCDYYKRLYMRYGAPTILQEVTAVNRSHSGQISTNCDQGEILALEKEYVLRKFLSNIVALENKKYHDHDNI
tara:strand:+ start:860 stop:1639 length:780 start_codon:yes stop_codon:yes gene_type:complete